LLPFKLSNSKFLGLVLLFLSFVIHADHDCKIFEIMTFKILKYYKYKKAWFHSNFHGVLSVPHAPSGVQGRNILLFVDICAAH
jgi:hypothetical protein